MNSIADSAERLRATDIHRSVIVQAPAGSGKTSLLVERFLNLLAVVDQPEEVLAITFTRKAAAEMRERVFAALHGESPIADSIRARNLLLGWGLYEQPMRLRIQTIDGLAASLVQRLPIGSGVGSQLRILEDAHFIYQEAIDRVFQRIDSNDPLAGDLVRLLELFDNDFDLARVSFSRMLQRRDQWLDAAMLALRAGRSDKTGRDPEQMRLDAVMTAMRAGIGALHAAVFEEIAAGLSQIQCDELAACAAFASRALALPWPWLRLPDTLDGWLFLTDLVTTKSGTPRKQLGTAQGFVDATATSQKMRLRLRAVIDSLAASDAIERFAAVRRLPSQNLDLASAHRLLTVATGLALSVVELSTLFRRDRIADFTELTFAAQRALGEADAPTDLALALDHRIKHLLIDEFQDTSALQHRLVTRLLHGWQPGDGRTVFLVGDPMQSIYRFRDADVALFQLARRHGIGSVPLESVRLTTNFRSSAALVHWCNDVFGPAFGATEDPIMGRMAFAPSAPTIEARRDDGCFNHIVAATGPDSDEAQRLVDTIERIRAQRPGESIAILVRNRSHLDRILPALSARNIAWVGTDIHLLAQMPVIDDLMNLLRCLSAGFDQLAWLALLRSPLVGLTLPDLETIASGDLVDAVYRGNRDLRLTQSGRSRLQRVRPTLQRAHRLRQQTRVRPWLEGVFIDLGGADAYADADALAHAHRFFSLIETEHPWTVQFRVLERAVQRLFADTPARAEAVTVMTIHRAKGLEFDHVLLPALHRVNPVDSPPVILWRPQGRELLLGVAGTRDQSVHTWLRREERQRDHHELIRLLYVAATRARFSLHLFATLDCVDSTPVAPPTESLLGQIWPIPVDTTSPNISNATKPIPPAHSRRVLPDNYVWSAPSPFREITLSAPRPAAEAGTLQDQLGDQVERAVGVIIHRELAALSRRSLPPHADIYASATRGRWRIQLENLGVHGTELETATDEVARQLLLVLADPTGQWLLAPHTDAASELEFTGYDGEQLVRMAPDRTFLELSGDRWIIDYKSSRPAPSQSRSEFIVRQRERHGAQLRRYKRSLANFGPENVRIAIYLTALPAFVELDADLDFYQNSAENPPP